MTQNERHPARRRRSDGQLFARGLGLAGALLLFSGCLDDGRPLEDYLAELEEIEQKRVDEERAAECGRSVPEEVPLETCSKTIGALFHADFVNERAGAVDVFWVDFNCVEKPYEALMPGSTRRQQSYAGHVWRFRDQCTGEVLLDWPGGASDTVAGSVVEVVIE